MERFDNMEFERSSPNRKDDIHRSTSCDVHGYAGCLYISILVKIFAIADTRGCLGLRHAAAEAGI